MLTLLWTALPQRVSNILHRNDLKTVGEAHTILTRFSQENKDRAIRIKGLIMPVNLQNRQHPELDLKQAGIVLKDTKKEQLN